MRRPTRFVLAVLLVTAVPVVAGASLGVVGVDDVGLGGVAAATGGTGADTTANETVSPSAYDDDFDVAAVEREIRRLVNERRATHDLARLERDTALRGVARTHSTDMATREFVGHETPDGEGLGDRIREADMADSCGSAGENVALGYVNRTFEVDDDRYHPTTETELATVLVEMWFASPSHRENLLANDWDTQAVGLYVTADGEVYATHLFCG
ncbi:CAP domain-containing protein [Haloparvum sp. AD34]